MILVQVHPEVKNWIRYAKFEENRGFINRARSVYEKGIEFYRDNYMVIDEKFFVAFAEFEETQREVRNYLYFSAVFLYFTNYLFCMIPFYFLYLKK